MLYAFMTALDKPWVVIRCLVAISSRLKGEERVGDVSNVFLSGWIADESARFNIYASSDTRMHTATSTIGAWRITRQYTARCLDLGGLR